MPDTLLARRKRSYARTELKFNALASKREDYTLSTKDEAEFDRLSEALTRKHLLVIRAMH